MWTIFYAGSGRLAKAAVQKSHRNARRRRRLTTITSTERTSTSPEGYQSIGSFHSDNLADLIALSDKDYVPPSLPFPDEPELPPRTKRKDSDDFLLDLEQFTFLNHGAFGAALEVGHNRAAAWRLHLERQPLRYFDRDLLPHLVYSNRLLAAFMDVPCARDAVLTVNATTALNSILAGYAREFRSASHIVLWDTTYGSVKKMAQHCVGAANVTEIPFQQRYLQQLMAAAAASSNSIQPHAVMQQALEDTWNSVDLTGKRPLLILDHTTSNTALTFPIQELAKQAAAYHPSPVIVVDGAHGLLAQDVRISELDQDVDFYVSNGHKWLCAPRGVAVMYSRPTWHDTILRRPAVISHGVDEPDLFSRFVWDGTRDYAAALALPAVLNYWKQRGPDTVRQQLRDTLRNGIQVLAEAWHPDNQRIEDWPGKVTITKWCDMLSPMALVQLPDRLGSGNTSTDAKNAQDYLYSQNIEVPVKCVQGELYVRVSCHVYNQRSDFVILANAIQCYLT